MRIILLTNLVLLFFSLLFLSLSVEGNTKSVNAVNSNLENPYQLAYPGMLPDNIFYKIKVLRNKIISKIIIDPVKKIEFDLLMADKTIHASELLLQKGKVDLAKETALKGENYFSNLVTDYNYALLQHKNITPLLDKKITLAAQKHQEVFRQLEERVEHGDTEPFRNAAQFSKINYEFVVGLRSPKK